MSCVNQFLIMLYKIGVDNQNINYSFLKMSIQNNKWTLLSAEEKTYCYKQDEKMDAFPHRQLCQTCKQILYFNANGEVRVRPNMCNTCDQIFRNINCAINAQRWSNLNKTLDKILNYLEAKGERVLISSKEHEDIPSSNFWSNDNKGWSVWGKVDN